MTRRSLIVAMMIVLTVTPLAALADQDVPRNSDGWRPVELLPREAELEIRLKSGKKVKGHLLNVSPSSLSLAGRDSIVDLPRNDIAKVYRLVPKSDDFRRFTGGVGAGLGGSVGLAVAITAASRHRGYGSGSNAGLALVAPIGALAGAIGGYMLGAKLKTRRLVYDESRVAP